jgi:hypothetical protein
VVVLAGEAETLAPDVEFNPVDGLQVKVEAPPAVSEVVVPGQMVVLELTVMMGGKFTFTVTWAVLLHPLLVPVTV